MSNFITVLLSFGVSIAGSSVLYSLPLSVQGYILSALSVFFALMDSFYGALISRTNSLTGLTVFSVDEYQDICDHVCDFQRRLLRTWLIGKLFQLFLAGIAVAEIQLKEPNIVLQCFGYVALGVSMHIFAYMVNTYIAREIEIFSIYKKARLKENEARLSASQSRRV